jgi:asparagine synthase (glutamine-hydrolysing)
MASAAVSGSEALDKRLYSSGNEDDLSGIVGVWNRDGSPLGAAVVHAMNQTLSHRGPDGSDVTVAETVGFAHQHLWVTLEEIGERQPILNGRGVMLAFDGRLDNRDELNRLLDLSARASDAACVLEAYQQWDEHFVERLAGDFALGLFDGTLRRLILARDPIGVRPLYFHVSPRFVAFASEIKALLAHPDIPARPDDEGIADALMIRVRPVEGLGLTCFAGVGALPPSHMFVVTPSDARRRKYWDFDGSARLELKSFDQYAEAFRDRFATAVRRRTRSAFPVAVSVSGGLDSSSIFCQAEALRRRDPAMCSEVVGVSYVGVGGTADERVFLESIEREYGVQVLRLALSDHLGLVEGSDRQLWHVETPNLDYLWKARVAIGQTMRARGARVLLSGHWGDQMLFSTGYLVDLARRGRWIEVARHLREYRRWLGAEEATVHARRFVPELARTFVPDALRAPLKRLKRRWIEREPRPWLASRFVESARGAANVPIRLDLRFHGTHARRLYLEARSAYHVQCMEWNNKAAAMDGHDHAFPFLDRDLVALLLAMPGTMQNRGGVPRAILREAMRGVLPEDVRARTWKGDFSDAVNLGVSRDFAAIAGLLTRDGQAVARGYFDPDGLDRAVATRRPPAPGDDCLDSWDLADAFGFELWLRVFFAHDSSGQAGPRSHDRVA